MEMHSIAQRPTFESIAPFYRANPRKTVTSFDSSIARNNEATQYLICDIPNSLGRAGFTIPFRIRVRRETDDEYGKTEWKEIWSGSQAFNDQEQSAQILIFSLVFMACVSHFCTGKFWVENESTFEREKL